AAGAGRMLSDGGGGAPRGDWVLDLARGRASSVLVLDLRLRARLRRTNLGRASFRAALAICGAKFRSVVLVWRPHRNDCCVRRQKTGTLAGPWLVRVLRGGRRG